MFSCASLSIRFEGQQSSLPATSCPDIHSQKCLFTDSSTESQTLVLLQLGSSRSTDLLLFPPNPGRQLGEFKISGKDQLILYSFKSINLLYYFPQFSHFKPYILSSLEQEVTHIIIVFFFFLLCCLCYKVCLLIFEKKQKLNTLVKHQKVFQTSQLFKFKSALV